MNRKLRLILIIVGALVLLLVIAPFLIPVNQFRPTIEDKASAALGRKVQVGNLSLSLVGGSVGAESLSIGDDPKFSQSPFLTAKSVKVGVELLPLIFSKTLNVTGVTIENPEVTLLRNPAGQWNYSSLGGPSAKFESAQASAPKAPVSSSPAEFSVKQLDPAGQRFDPSLHEAVLMQESGAAAPNTVLQVVQPGYELKGRLLRPARVIVAKGAGA